MSHDPTDSLVRLLDTADTLPGAAELRAHSYDLLGLAPGQAVVDVGCGAGRAVEELAEQGVCPIGVDVDERMVAVARERWPGRDFRLAGADALPLADGEVVGYRADKVFHQLADPEVALVEARRVLARGGRIVLVGQDWDGFLIDADDPELTRLIVHARADTVPNPRVARRYRNLLLDNGFTDVTVEVRTGVITDAAMLPMVTGLVETAHRSRAISREQADIWTADQAERARTDRFLVATPLFVAAATVQ
ncbi:methyltransferase domain-containing protein [Actinocrispum wychmicini]|uniref:Methyltransferase family protein n=1 Tax=Actinocrispum wychmicini TaxID=1213861 RepID=A0A4R2JMR9_9PSEU|nr:methyltransferase domain-containing protein [Actinocrispum wychmicini]TCO60594.1 methyltransferase family protein [Actinocrispum wychmicini]